MDFCEREVGVVSGISVKCGAKPYAGTDFVIVFKTLEEHCL